MEDFTPVFNLEAFLKYSEAMFFSAKSKCSSFNSNMTVSRKAIASNQECLDYAYKQEDTRDYERKL